MENDTEVCNMPTDLANHFNDMGQILYSDFSQGISIRAGQLFEGKTVKGGRNLIVAMRQKDGWMYFMHGEKCRKIELDKFVNAVAHGDLEPKLAQEIDTERLSKAAIGLDAIANRRSVSDHLDCLTEQAEMRAKGRAPVQF